MQLKNKMPYAPCSTDQSIGNDPQGFAWAVYNYTPGGYGFNYYVSYDQVSLDWELVFGIRADSHPTAAVVAAGHHYVDVIGYNDLNDPFSAKPQALYGLYILDPWGGDTKGNSHLLNWPYNGFQPNTFVTIDNWNNLYFLKDNYSGVQPWYTRYTVILRSYTDAPPTYPPPESYGDWMYGQMGAATAASLASSRTLASATFSADLQDAVVKGIQQNGLERGGALGIDLTGYTVGPSVHVDSLAQQFSPYDLVEIDVAGHVQAVAMVTESARGFSFAALTPWTGSFDLASSSAVGSALTSAGMTGPGRLVWAWTEEGGSPFMPMIEAKDAATAAPAYLTSRGRYDKIHLTPGETASGT